MTRRILFVDDQIEAMAPLRSMMEAMRGQTSADFVGSASEALALMEKSPYEVVVTDMRMPGMDGAQLLESVMRRWPTAVRILLADPGDRASLLCSIGAAHQVLAKPCEGQALISVITRSCALHELLGDEKLKSRVSRMTTLPTLPSVYTEVCAALQDSDSSMQKVARLIRRDLSMTAKMLHLVNSSFFGLSQRITEPLQAISLVGLDTLKTIILGTEVFSQFEGRDIGGFNLESFSQHGMAVASLSRAIASSQDAPREVLDDSLMAGMLHDVGKLVLAVNLPREYRAVMDMAQQTGKPLYQLEAELMGLTHAEVGAFLMGLWGMPDPVLEAIAYHHHPADDQHHAFGALVAVHAADALHNCNSPDAGMPSGAIQMDMAYLKTLGLNSRLSAWLAVSLKAKEQRH